MQLNFFIGLFVPHQQNLVALLLAATTFLACDPGSGGSESESDTAITQTSSDSDSDTIGEELPCTPQSSPCGPSTAVVKRVIDGDTIELDSGERVRLLNLDAPENTSEKECYGQEATNYLKNLAEGETVCLTYEAVECTDIFDRLLAFVQTPDGEANTLLVENGFACVLVIPPAGVAREPEFRALEQEAMNEARGLWGSCDPSVCKN
ncbi:MAG: thermonuclease family protein [Nannocystaceae bacterium]